MRDPALEKNENGPRPLRDRFRGTDRDWTAGIVRRNADKCTRSWYALVFGTRGSQVQILPLRPTFPRCQSVRGLIWGTKLHIGCLVSTTPQNLKIRARVALILWRAVYHTRVSGREPEL
jgi:hypothetical protein